MRLPGFALQLPALAAVVLAVALATPATAAFGPVCPPGGCLFDPENSSDGFGGFDFDYTVPPDGQAYRWTIAFTSADPFAAINFDTPNQTEIITDFRDGSFEFDSNPDFTFQPLPNQPGRAAWIVRAPLQFDNCALPGPNDVPCARTVNIFGNGTFLRVTSAAPVFATFSETAVPEPASWAMMVLGFGLTGAAMRRRRVAVVSA